MARHIMAVCVVCLLCAEHLPCEEHIETVSSNLRLNAKVFHGSDLNRKTSDYTNFDFQHNENNLVDGSYDKARRRRKNADSRSKRHAGGHHTNTMESHSKPEITDDFIQRIFQEYGQEDGTIHINQLENMLKKLGLYKMVEERASNETCASSHQIVDSVKHHHQEDHHTKSGHKCMSDPFSKKPCKQSAAQSPSKEKESLSLNSDDLINLCPVLLYQLASNSSCLNSSLLHDDDLFPTLEPPEKELFYVWTYAFLSVLACGLLGLIGVAIIPFMDSRYYKHIIQYLVSLAVGTMTGDALLHLLPHSLAGQSESNMVYKGLTCMGGIIFFYITEHGLTMISEWRKGRAKKDTQTSRAKVVRDPESSINNSVAGDKLCKSKYSSYPYCYDEIAMDTKNDVWLHLPNPEGNDVNAEKNNSSSRENGDANETAQSLLSQNYTPISDLNHRLPDSNTISTNLDDTSLADGTTGGSCGKDKPLVRNDTVTVILREHESSHHGHSHKHGHVHSPPESLSAVAWMIIMGDGLHNFTDGMAIGAAFADNIAGGCSTSLAVFCHELPHELGDFAILIKAGMSVKSAVYYNLLTGILSFIGMIVGILFGQSQEAAQWMFAAAAGLFIYIALVDMMPELSAAHKTLEQFALQIFGMTTGVLLMLLIAVNENRLMTLFSPNPGEIGGHSHSH